MRNKLDQNVQQYARIIDVLREFYQVENSNPGGVVFANTTGSYSGTVSNLQSISGLQEIHESALSMQGRASTGEFSPNLM